MPPHPPEETSVLAPEDGSLSRHSKASLDISPSRPIGHNRGASLTIDRSMMAPPPPNSNDSRKGIVGPSMSNSRDRVEAHSEAPSLEPNRRPSHKNWEEMSKGEVHTVSTENEENPLLSSGSYGPAAHAQPVPVGDEATLATNVAAVQSLKSSHVSLWKKATWIMFTMGIFLLPYVILKACFHIQVSAGAWQTSVTYGMLMALDFMAVISFSALNRRSVNNRVKRRDPHWVGLSTGIVAVGYREDPVLLEGCLKSLRAMRYQRNQRVMLVVDGNDFQDEYMAQIFMKVFEKQGATVIRPDFLCMDRLATDKDRVALVRQIAYHPGPVCVMQPHRGKRSAMYTGFAALLQQGIESVVVTDSDTYLDPHVCKGMFVILRSGVSL
ncbi:Hyaluronan synthase 3 [Podila epigama]|nr:Hyaluronan synthase 3 [Podila epigama]